MWDTGCVRGAAVIGVLVAGCYSPQPPAGTPCPDGICPSPLVCSPATQTCEAAAADAAIDTPDVAVPRAEYRRRLTITNAASTTLPAGFAIRVSLDLADLVAAGKLRADMSDLRVIARGQIGERHRIVDAPGGPAPVAITFALAEALGPGDNTTDYAVHYGGESTTPPLADGTNVFAVYDDFTTAISSDWATSGAPTLTNGQLVLRAGNTDAIRTTASSDGVPIVSEFEIVASVDDPNSEPTVQTEGTFWYWFGYQRTSDFTPTDPWCVWIARAKNAISGEQKSPVGCEAGCSGTADAQDTTAHYFAIQRDTGQTRFYRNDALSSMITVTNSTDYALMIRNYMATSDLRVDWVRARARVSPAPTVTPGVEETL